ncbi:MAG: CoA pyrophosphatase [Candidatus Sericytochromatia bacterium]
MLELIKNKLGNNLFKEDIAKEDFTLASVLIPLYKKNDKTYILFTKRSNKVKHHKGQISFPGGKFETNDKNLQETSLRETYEEIGVKPEDIEIIGKMPSIITISNFYVTPFVGYFNYPYNFKISTDEIDTLIEAPLEHFFDESIFWIENREVFGNIKKVYFYSYEGHTIWGATGKILYDLLRVIR